MSLKPSVSPIGSLNVDGSLAPRRSMSGRREHASNRHGTTSNFEQTHMQDIMLHPAATRSDAMIDGEIARRKQMKEEWVREMRGWLMVLAVLAASVTYQAGLNPPGAYWQDNEGHEAGYPILADKALRRYMIFYIFNSMAFVNSIIIIVLLMKVTFFYGEVRLNVLRTWLLLDLFWLIGAYAAGTTRELVSSVIAVVLQVVIFPIVVYDVWCRERSREKFPTEQRGDAESGSNGQRPS